jgi:excisionase family DNA binding protein
VFESQAAVPNRRARRVASPVDNTAERDAYTIPNAAHKLNVGTRTIERWLAAGVLRSFKIGHVRRIPRVEIERLLSTAE